MNKNIIQNLKLKIQNSKSKISLRFLIQCIALIGSNMYLGFIKTKQLYQGVLKSSCVPFLNCHSCPGAVFSCPIGSIQHFLTIKRIPYIILGYLFAVGITVGSMVCGWLCPFGFIQDLMYKIKSFKIKIPRQISQLRYLILLFFVILLPFLTQETWFSKLCPMGTIQAALPWIIWNPTIPVYNESAVSLEALGLLFTIKIIILIGFIILFIISKRPFCRLTCPLGAILGFFNRFSLLRLNVNTKNCKDCDKCVKTCPVDLNVGKDPNDSTCVRCLNCLKCENVKLNIGGMNETIDFLNINKDIEEELVTENNKLNNEI